MALHFVPGIGDFLIRQLISYGGTACDVFRLSKAKLIKIPGIGEATAQSILTGKSRSQAEREFRKAEAHDAVILFFTDKAFPYRLKSIDDAPSLLYIKGHINLNAPKTVAIVGTRQATTYGKEMVEHILDGLIPHRPLIISGLAYGIDIHAHKHALKKQLPTVGVLGSGIDVIYPAAHQEVARKMTSQGGLITENPFGTGPDAHNFPARNRIIAGLCDALIVVEAAETGGALITANIANTYNKDVFAIPGNVGNSYSEGCNKLIKIHKANLLTSAKDLEYIMNWSSTELPSPAQLVLELNSMDHNELRIVTVLLEKKVPMMLDELAIKTGMEPGLLASMLLNLEFRNVVVALPGKSFRLANDRRK